MPHPAAPAAALPLPPAAPRARERARGFVLRRAAQVPKLAAHVARDARDVRRGERPRAIRRRVSATAAAQAAQRLRLAPHASRLRAVPALVAALETVEAQAAAAVAREVVEVAAQVARALLLGKRALALEMAAASASEASRRVELEVVVEVPRVAQEAADFVILALVQRVRGLRRDGRDGTARGGRRIRLGYARRLADVVPALDDGTPRDASGRTRSGVPSRSSAFIDALFVVVVGVGFALAFAFSSSATAAAAFGAFASFDEVAALFRRFSAFSTMSAWCGSASSSSSVPPSDDGSGDGDGDARARRFFPRGFPPIAPVARARSATRRDARNFSRREAFALMSTRALNENRWFLHRGGDVCIKSASMHTMYDARASARPRRLRPPPSPTPQSFDLIPGRRPLGSDRSNSSIESNP